MKRGICTLEAPLSKIYMCVARVITMVTMAVSREVFVRAAAEAMLKAETTIPEDVKDTLQKACEKEKPPAKQILQTMLLNCSVAAEKAKPICQDTGIPIYFVKVGLKAQIDFDISKALGEAYSRVARELPLPPIITNPVTRATSLDVGERIPIVHYSVDVNSDHVDICAVPQGWGAESWCAIKMFPPGEDMRPKKKFILDTVVAAGGRACPPVVVGVGLGGDFELAAKMAKEASSLRPLTKRHTDPEIAQLEEELLDMVNSLGIGPMGMGGVTTALAVNIETASTHIPGTFVAVSIHCWPVRRAVVRVDKSGYRFLPQWEMV